MNIVVSGIGKPANLVNQLAGFFCVARGPFTLESGSNELDFSSKLMGHRLARFAQSEYQQIKICLDFGPGHHKAAEGSVEGPYF